MSPEVRKTLGIQTVEEAQEAYDDQLEKGVRKLCLAELSRRGVRVVHHLSHRAREHKGYPDLTFCYAGRSCACELKRPKGGVVSDDQARMHADMRRDGWTVAVCNTFDAFRGWLDGVMACQEGGQ